MGDPRLEIQIRSGAPAVSIPKETHLAVLRILNNLTVTGAGQLIKGSNDSWSIYISPQIGNWSGRVFFGGELVYETNPATFNNTHVKINLKTGLVIGDDWDEQDTGDLNEFEYYSVKSKQEDPNNAGSFVYVLNNNTAGDIHCRIT